MIYDVFVKHFEESYENFSADLASQIGKATENTKFYLTDNSLVLYFDMNQLDLPIDYIPTVELKYNEDVFKIDLSDAELDSLVIDLEGNPTTGYQWMVISADSDKLEVKDEYIPDENKEELVDKGGTSIGANINEANYGNSKADFISKLHIALKEKYDKIKRAKKLNLLRE